MFDSSICLQRSCKHTYPMAFPHPHPTPVNPLLPSSPFLLRVCVFACVHAHASTRMHMQVLRRSPQLTCAHVCNSHGHARSRRTHFIAFYPAPNPQALISFLPHLLQCPLGLGGVVASHSSSGQGRQCHSQHFGWPLFRKRDRL